MIRCAAVFGILLGVSSSAFAQSSVRVITDQAIVWQPGFLAVATVVNRGTVLEVIQRQGNWYEVRLIASGTTSATRGFISSTQVELIGPAPRSSPPTGSTQTRSRPLTPAQRGSVRSGLVASGHFGYGLFQAKRSFDAVFGSHTGLWFGVGAEYRFRSGFFVGGDAERFQRTGERVFVSDAGDVFKLGSVDKVSIVPVSASVGYHVMHGKVSPYVSGGIGRYFFSETSPVAINSENFHHQVTGYHVSGGIEWRAGAHLAAGFEARYALVPDGLSGVVSDAFKEHDLGGFQTRFKVIVW
jgi:hypothetical protein